MKHIPIICSVGRIMLLPFVVWQHIRGNTGAMAALFMLSGAVEAGQGYLARRLHLMHRAGAVLDPIADRLTQALACILLAFQRPACWWVFAAVLGKDLVSLALGSWLLMNDIESAGAIWTGKVCDLLFYACVAAVMCRSHLPVWLLHAALLFMVFSLALSAFSFLPAFVRHRRQCHQASARTLRRKGERPEKIRIKAYGFFAIGVVPLSTLAFAGLGNPLEVNLSIIGNEPGHRAWFILWGMLCAGFFVMIFRRTLEMAACKGRAERWLLLAACTSFIACVLTPFLPEQYPRAANWHNRLAVAAPLLVLLVSCLLSRHLRRIDRKLYRNALSGWLFMTCLDVFLMYTTGISGLFEMVFIITISLHTYHIMERLYRLKSRQAPGCDAQGSLAVQ